MFDIKNRTITAAINSLRKLRSLKFISAKLFEYSTDKLIISTIKYQ